MGMTMTQKILAAHAGLDHVEAGQLILVNLDRVLGNDITSPGIQQTRYGSRFRQGQSYHGNGSLCPK